MEPWKAAVEAIKPAIVRIRTPTCSGTGFLVARSKEGDLCGIATAAHVVQHADEWQQPLRIDHLPTGGSVLLKPGSRAIYIDAPRDTAAVIMAQGDLKLPAEPPFLIPEKHTVHIGVELGWLGYPALAPDNACFFKGCASCWLAKPGAYLVDGVAINGVSGGPAFLGLSKAKPMVAGIVSAYIPNQATGELLPGLAMLSDVVQLHEVIRTMRNLDEAREAAREAASNEREEPVPAPGRQPA